LAVKDHQGSTIPGGPSAPVVPPAHRPQHGQNSGHRQTRIPRWMRALLEHMPATANHVDS